MSSWTQDDLRKIFDLRALLESTAAGRAAPRMTPAEIEPLRDLASGMEQLAERGADDFLDRLGDLNREFHAIIMKTADDERLTRSVVQTIEFPIVLRTFQRYRPADLRRSLSHHRELIDAFQVRDGEWASSVMRAHVLAAKHVILSP